MIIYIIKSFKRKYNIYKMEYTDEKDYNRMLAEKFMEIELMPELVEEVILPDKVQRRLMRPLKEEIRINARSIYDELPILMQDEVKRAEIAVLLAKTDYDRVYKRNLAREKKGRSDESDDGEGKNKLTKYELLNNKEEIYDYYQTCRKYSVTAKHFGISDFLVKKVVSQH